MTLHWARDKLAKSPSCKNVTTSGLVTELVLSFFFFLVCSSPMSKETTLPWSTVLP